MRSRIVGKRLQRTHGTVIALPCVADAARQELRQPRIGQDQEAPRADAVRYVSELLRHDVMEVPQHSLLEQLAVQRGDAVDGAAADAREICHAHIALSGFVDQ